LPAVLNGAGGFLYYVSVAGITGMQQAATANVAQAVAKLKANTDLPVAVGFGVRTPDQAAAIAEVADGVVVGSAIIDVIARAAEDGSDPAPAVARLVKDLSGAVRAARKEKAA
jgi:tryptophan synthase alpha chain